MILVYDAVKVEYLARSIVEQLISLLISCSWQIFKEVPAVKKPFWSEFVIGFRLMTDVELKHFPDHKFGQAFTTLKCECSTYLPWLEKRFIPYIKLLLSRHTIIYSQAFNYK